MGEISAWLEQTPGPGRVLFDVRSAKRLAAEERDFAQSAAATAQLRALGAPLRWAYLARPEQTLLLDLTKQLLAVTPGASCDCRTFSEDVEALAWLDGDTPSVSKPSRIEAASEAA